MKKIYVDMDGVLSNFNKGYSDLFGKTPAEVRASSDRRLYGVLWNQFVDQRQFAKLEMLDGAERLIEYLNNLAKIKYQICILSSAGGFDRQREVMEQKLEWLSAHGIDWPAVIVPGRRYKSGFADPTSLLIDDTYDVIKEFAIAGTAVWHDGDYDVTIGRVSNWVM